MNGATTIITVNSSPFTQMASANTTYVYHIRAVDAGGSVSAFSNRDLATTMTFASLQPGVTLVSSAHFNDLLAAVNAVRAASGSPELTWLAILSPGTPAPAPGVVVDEEHITALRVHMDSALTALGLPTWPYTDPTLAGAVIKTIHLAELRERTQ